MCMHACTIYMVGVEAVWMKGFVDHLSLDENTYIQKTKILTFMHA
jgi:hypothetical protein